MTLFPGRSDSSSPSEPTTVVLIHGLWMTPRSWEHWVKRYSKAGYRVLAPAWPGMDREVEQLRDDPSPISGLTGRRIIEHYERIVRELDRPPIIMGHNLGGAVAQVLLDRGLGAAGVAIDSTPVHGVPRLPFATMRSTFPVWRNPLNLRRAVPLTRDQFRYAFTNAMSKADSDRVYERYHVPGAGHVLFEGLLTNLNPLSAFRVDLGNTKRAPLLFVAGGADHATTDAVERSIATHYQKSPAIIAFRDFPGRTHFSIGQEGWEEVADFALEWAREAAAARQPQPR